MEKFRVYKVASKDLNCIDSGSLIVAHTSRVTRLLIYKCSTKFTLYFMLLAACTNVPPWEDQGREDDGH